MNTEECAVCYQPTEMALICGHPLCIECADNWVNSKHTCPTCRQKSDYITTIDLTMDDDSETSSLVSLDLMQEVTYVEPNQVLFMPFNHFFNPLTPTPSEHEDDSDIEMTSTISDSDSDSDSDNDETHL